MKAEEFDKKFDDGEDITEHLDLSRARRVNQELKRVNVDFPVWVIEALDKGSQKVGSVEASPTEDLDCRTFGEGRLA